MRSKPENPYKITKLTLDDPDVAERFNRVLGATVEALDKTGVRYAFIGGIASGGMGRPRSTHDIDLFVMPDDADLALRSLAKHGFRTERTDPSWLFKGFKEDILVDVIFKSKGDIYLDTEMYQRLNTVEYHGRQLRLVAPEDLLIIKAVAHTELTPGHWHDAIGLLSHASLDWAYLLKRARRAPRRVLSVLLYAQSSDIWVPNHVIHELYDGIFSDSRNGAKAARPAQVEKSEPSRVVPLTPAPQFPSQAAGSRGTGFADPKVARAYVVPHLRECLAEDVRTHELDILIEQQDDTILLRGEVASPERREAVEKIARECYPELEVENQIRILSAGEPTETEAVTK